MTHQDVSVFEIVSPVGPDLPLAPDVPDVELESFRLDRLDVEALRRRDVGGVLGGQGLQDGRLAGVVLKSKLFYSWSL